MGHSAVGARAIGSLAGEPAGRAFDADTLAWVAGGDSRWCACDECWAQQPFWRYVQMLLDACRRARPGSSRQEIADFVWSALSASRPRRALWSLRDPPLASAVQALRRVAARDRYNPGELYEVVLRGIAQRDGGP
jgi:hypothetical protein